MQDWLMLILEDIILCWYVDTLITFNFVFLFQYLLSY